MCSKGSTRKRSAETSLFRLPLRSDRARCARTVLIGLWRNLMKGKGFSRCHGWNSAFGGLWVGFRSSFPSSCGVNWIHGLHTGHQDEWDCFTIYCVWGLSHSAWVFSLCWPKQIERCLELRWVKVNIHARFLEWAYTFMDLIEREAARDGKREQEREIQLTRVSYNLLKPKGREKNSTRESDFRPSFGGLLWLDKNHYMVQNDRSVRFFLWFVSTTHVWAVPSGRSSS